MWLNLHETLLKTLVNSNAKDVLEEWFEDNKSLPPFLSAQHSWLMCQRGSSENHSVEEVWGKVSKCLKLPMDSASGV